MMDRYGIHGWGMGWWWIIAIFIILAIIWILVKTMNKDSTINSPPDNLPMDILKERYAKGEIEKKEFEERKKDLQ